MRRGISTALLALQGFCLTRSLVLADVPDQTVSTDPLAARSVSSILEQRTLTDDWFAPPSSVFVTRVPIKEP